MMKNRLTVPCPDCGNPGLYWYDLILLSRRPIFCRSCWVAIENPPGRLFLGILLGLTLAFGSFRILNYLVPDPFVPFLSAVVGTALFFGSTAVMAVPVAVRAEPKGCAVCGKLNVGYFAWERKICAGCVERIEKERIRGVPSTRTQAAWRPTRFADAPSLFEQLKRTRKDGSFVAFNFDAPSENRRERKVSLQFSVEQGRVGLDWVLIEPRNILDQDRFEESASRLGYALEAREMNDVRYLRVETAIFPGCFGASWKECTV